ncbi:MAG: transposase [Deltaproteobacteria bacterium]|nr:transposase [Deltaproteobacteria bacterium]
MARKYYIGLDGHSKNCFFVVLNSQGKVIRREKTPTSEAQILQFIRQYSGEIHLVMDETTITQWLYVLLNDKVERIVVTQSERHSSSKTDFKEAEQHAQDLRANNLKIRVYHSCDALMELRAMVSGYKDLIQNVVAEKNRYNALFRQSAITRAGTSLYKDAEWIKSLRTDSQRFVANPLFERIQLLERHRELYEKQFRENCNTHKEIRLLTSVPGIGAIRANQIVAQVVSPYRFPTKYNFFAYCLLVRHFQNSDGVTYGQKKPHGQSDLKGIFKSSRLSVLKGSSALRLKYDLMLANGASQKAAFNALGRSIASTVLGVWKSGQEYNDKKTRERLNSTYKNNLT